MGKGARIRRSGRIRKALRRTPPAYFDLVQWLRDRKYARTNKEARELILAKRVKADSHALGVGEQFVYTPEGPKMVEVVMPHVPVEFKGRVVVSEAT